MSVLGPILRWVLKHRRRIPLLGRIADSIRDNPKGLASRGTYWLGGGDRTAPPPPTAPTSEVRVLVGATNYAGQGELWARALERNLPDVGARSLTVSIPGVLGFPADSSVPVSIYRHSVRWQEAAFKAVSTNFTHVLLESMRPLFGSRFESVAAEIQALRDAGVSVALIAHGTDIRSPRKHLATNAWSPFEDGARAHQLEDAAAAARRLASEVELPTFVSTPDLLDDLPLALWCPVVVDPRRWQGGDAPFTSDEPPLVVHAPSSSSVKGTELIEPALFELHETGRIRYKRLSGIPSTDMPALIREADIVLDQFRIGSYGVAACEAMAAGRVVMGHATASVRSRVVEATGLELPIVEADPGGFLEALERVLADRSSAQEVAASGQAFVERVHSGPWSAGVLQRGWLGIHRSPTE